MRKIKLLLLSAVAAVLMFQGCKKIDESASDAVANSSKSTGSTKAFSGIFTNELAGGGAQDPWVIRAGGKYWYCGSDGGAIWVSSATVLHEILLKPRTYIFIPPAGLPYSHHIWAPELHYRGGRWYVYFAGTSGANADHRMFALEGGTDSTNPLNGGYIYKSKLTTITDRWAIDGHPFTFNGQNYFIWSGWPGFQDVIQNLYIATMSNPYTLSGERVLISTPYLSWEATINEGPTALIGGTTVNIIYSANGSWTNNYCLGRISNHPGRLDIMNPTAWGKLQNPVFKSFGNIYGPGHASFTVSPDGIQPWIMYHSAFSNGSGWDRRINIQQYHWEWDIPYFGFPIEKGIPIPSPSIGAAYHSPIPNGNYKIRNRYSGLALDAPGYTAGAQIYQWTVNGSVNQKWTFTALGNGYYKIKSVLNGLCMDNSGASYNPGNPIVQWNDTGHFCQQWRVQDMGNGTFQLTNRMSLLNLNNPNSSTTVGATMNQWYVNQYDAELWHIESNP